MHRVVSHADGTVVCFGQGCNVTFQTSAFKRCTLVAMEGARVAVADCVFSNDTSKCDGLGVIASGAGTTVVMQVRLNFFCTVCWYSMLNGCKHW